MLIFTFASSGLSWGEVYFDTLAVQAAQNREKLELEARKEELAERVRDFYNSRDPETVRILEKYGHEFSRITAFLLTGDMYNDGDTETVITETMADFRPADDVHFTADDVQQYREALQNVLDFCRQWETDHEAREFIDFLATYNAIGYYIWFCKPSAPATRFTLIPEQPTGLEDTLYIDLASGINFGRTFANLNPRAQYVAVDTDYFTFVYLRELADLHGLHNTVIIQEDVLTLPRPMAPVGTIRVKNVTSYVPEFPSKLREILDWIYADDEKAGQLVLAVEPSLIHRQQLIGYHGTLIAELIEKGWSVEFAEGTPCPDCGTCINSTNDVIILGKPKTGTRRVSKAAKREACAQWDAYLELTTTSRIDGVAQTFLGGQGDTSIIILDGGGLIIDGAMDSRIIEIIGIDPRTFLGSP